MCPPHSTNAVDIFLEMDRACRAGVQMIPRSSGDKEFFAQDWFKDRLKALGLPHTQQGRNSYPDFIAGHPDSQEGYEIKSLAVTRGQPARSDLDFNSTIPSGIKTGRDVFLVFILYTGLGAEPRSIHTISLAHANLINSDHAVADDHLNVAVHQFGSYGDGFIRNRKMYVFPHPVSLDRSGLGRRRLLTPESWRIADPRLRTIGTISRTVSQAAVESYTIQLHGRGEASVTRAPYPNAGMEHRFSIFEVP